MTGQLEIRSLSPSPALPGCEVTFEIQAWGRAITIKADRKQLMQLLNPGHGESWSGVYHHYGPKKMMVKIV